MAETCTLTGIVLRSTPAGEYDKRIVLLTKERGKVTCFARGARRSKSALQASTNLFCFGTFEAYAGRDSYTVVKAEIRNYFRELSMDLDRTYYGCYFLELADFFTREELDGTDQLKLLYQSLRALSVKSIPMKLVRCIYEWKTLSIYGVAPFEPQHKLDEGTVYTLQYIISSPVQKLYTFNVSDAVYHEMKTEIRYHLKKYVDRELKTAFFLPDD